MERSKLKEALRPFVQEALSDYLKDTQADMQALQNSHPQLDFTDTPSEKADWTYTRGVQTESHAYTANYEPSESRKVWVQYSYARSGGQEDIVVSTMLWKDGWKKAEEKNFHNERDADRYLDTLVKKYNLKKELGEASSTAGGAAGPYSTPYAFSDTDLSHDAKKRKIAQQLGYKIVEKKRLKEEVNVNILKAIPLTEDFSPKLVTPTAHQLYMKMLDYLIMTDDPQYSRIHQFRNAIQKISNTQDREQLIRYFTDEFGKGISGNAWEYYKDPY